MKLTADTITDEHIRLLLEAAELKEYDATRRLRSRRTLCSIALNATSPSLRVAARARCAEILNARGPGD